MENRKGARRDSTSGVRGVRWVEQLKKWRAEVRHNNKTIHVGYYATIEEADAAARNKRQELYLVVN